MNPQIQAAEALVVTDRTALQAAETALNAATTPALVATAQTAISAARTKLQTDEEALRVLVESTRGGGHDPHGNPHHR